MTVLLFIGSANAATLTVDDSGGADYKRIQDAINAASDGDTILVYSGTYSEYVNINKRLVLRGIDNGGGKPVVNAGGSDSAVTLSAGWSTIEGFTVTNSGMFGWYKDDGIKVVSNNNIIKNNNVLNSQDGISLYYSNNNILNGNAVLNNNLDGIWVENSNNNTLSDNTASNNKDGIAARNSNNNTLNGNSVSNNNENGIWMENSNNNVLSGNTASNNKDPGIWMENSNNNVLSGNTVSSNGGGVGFSNSINNRVHHNNIINNYAYEDAINIWDNGLSGGNYWSDYTGTDANSDGIGDMPYNISGRAKAQDRYPLMVPYRGQTPQLIPTALPSPTATPAIFVSNDQTKEIGYKLLWNYTTKSFVDNVLISSDGSYIAGSSGSTIYFFNRDGKLLWNYTTSHISISSDGSHIVAWSWAVGSGDYNIYFFNRDGKLLWNYTTDSSVDNILVSSDGSYIAGSWGNTIYLFNRDGKLLWNYKTDGIIRGVSISSDGSYIAGSWGNTVYLFNRDGKLLWNYKIGSFIVESVLISPDGFYIAIVSWENTVYLFNRDGRLLWNYKIDDNIKAVSISSDGSYIAAWSLYGREVYFFNRDGKLLWKYKTDDIIRGVSISSDGSYIAGSWGNTVYLFNRDGKLLWDYKTDDIIKAVSISSDGSYIAAGEWTVVHLFAKTNIPTPTETPTPIPSPTPTFTPKFYPEHPKSVEVDGEVNLNKESLSFGDTLNIKAKIKLIGIEKIYGAPVLILWKMENGKPTVSITTWQLTETNQVIKVEGFKDFEDWWIPHSKEFNFNVNWLWENPKISSGTYQIQVAISTRKSPNSPEGWFLSGDNTTSHVQLEGASSWIPIPTSVSRGLSSSAIIVTIITVLAIFLIFLAVVYSNRKKDEKLIIQRIDELIVGLKTKKLDNNELRDKLIEINKELSHKESYGTSYKGYFFAVALVLSVLLLLGYLTLAPEAEAPINMKSISTPAPTIKATPNITHTPTVTPTKTTTATPVRLKVVEDVFNGDASAANKAGLEKFENGYYYVVDWQGDKYVALKGKTTKLVKLILEQRNAENKVLAVGETWDIGGGWIVMAQSIDAKASPRRVWLVLFKDGVKKDDKVIGQGDPYVYVEKSFAGESDVPLFVTYIARVYAGATSDMVQLSYTWAVDTTTIQTPKITPTVSPTLTPPITETPTPEPAVVATPTGKIVYGRVDYGEFSVSNLQIYTGDAISWNNFDEYTSYTIVEMDQKLPNMTLRPYGRLTYVFNTTGNYRFGLYYPLMKTGPRIQNITVRVSPAPMITSITDQKTITNSVGMEFIMIPSGEFDMGSPSNEAGRYDNEGPVHHVKIANAFYMGKYEVTQKQWREVMESNPSEFKGDNLPVEMVSWNDIQEFIRKLNEKEGTNKYRLPSEAEWEYAARAGTRTRYSFGVSESELGDYAWYSANSGDKTHEVGQKEPNPWGLYDMHGNVWEWVQDKWHSNYNGAPTDGSAWEGGGSDRIVRGGSWYRSAVSSRSAHRGGSDPSPSNRLGFRLLKDL